MNVHDLIFCEPTSFNINRLDTIYSDIWYLLKQISGINGQVCRGDSTNIYNRD